MAIKLPQKKFRTNLLIACTSLLLLGALPHFTGSGLDNPEPIGAYLNGNFPANLPQGDPYIPVFPNLTFSSPLTFNEIPGQNKIIVGQRDGQIFWFDKTPNVVTKNSLLDLSDKVGVVWDGGFLGLALHPQFGTPGKNFFYVWYTTEDANSNDFPNFFSTLSCDNEEYWGNFLILARYEADPVTLSVQESTEQILLKLRMYGTTHRGGGLLFGDDGFLYLTTGDQTASAKSQDIHNNLDGGVLRLDVDQDPTKSHPPVRTMPADHGFSDEISGNGYWIPNDNPFLSPNGESFEEYFTLGHRNPHRMTKDRATGILYMGEIGGGRHEEINIIEKGSNYGWPVFEGFFQGNQCGSNLYNSMPHEQPLVAFPRAEANAIIGGYVYRGTEVPELQGKYLCADYGNGEEIFTVDINTGSYEQFGNFASTNIISFGEDEQGELYILKQGVSTLFKIRSKTIGLGNTPTLLSQTGAFTDLNTLNPTDGLIPYDLVESFWSDGALKKRWMAVPNDGSHDTASEKVVYSDVGDWDFPVGSVLVKHFELPIDQNNPQLTRRLETRFSIKASDGNFYFLTYKWNAQQTDADLLTAGLEEDIPITLSDGSTENQTWYYPSAADCTSCHNSATGGTLGTRTRYLNKDFTYSKTGRTGNQLVTLSHLGILDQLITDADTGSLLTSKAQNDTNASLDEKARSYLDLNCAYCHRSDADTRANFDLRLNLDFVQTGLLTAQPNVPLGIPDEKILDPGSPGTSILYHRMNSADPAIRMPPIAKNKIDTTAVQMIDQWIQQLAPELCDDKIIMERFNNVTGSTIAELNASPNFPSSPDVVTELNEFSIPINSGDSYGVRVKGILKAPETGTYYFWVAGDDNVELNLSTDTDESNKTRIAYHDSWTFDEEWNKFSTQKSIGISLVADQEYYIEALMNENDAGDNLSVGWRRPSHGNGSEPFQIIPCTVFEEFDQPSVINVTGVNLSPESVTIIEGNTQQLNVIISPSNATDLGVIWSSDSTAIATVDTNGLVTAIAEGTAIITATTNDGGFTATSEVTVVPAPIPVTGVNLSPVTVTLTEGATQQLTATVIPSDADDQNITWLSSDTSIAIVNSEGLVTAVDEGTATITVSTNDGGFQASSEINVEEGLFPVTGVNVSPKEVVFLVGETRQLAATVLPSNADNPSVNWLSSNNNIATVDANGLVTGISEGSVTITVTTVDGNFSAFSGVAVQEECVLTNVALGGTASQSSTYGNGNASLAIDGNTTGTSPWSADLQHTNNETTPWWQVDLGAGHILDHLKIFNRTDGLQSRLRNFYVFVSNSPFPEGATLADLTNDTSLFSMFFDGPAGLEETLSLNTLGRYIRIQLSSNGIIHMAEVEVQGCLIENPPCDGIAPPVIAAAGPFNETDGIQTLSATPAGGTWSGASTDGNFDPSVGAGIYTVTYTYDNTAGCIQSDTVDIVVESGSGSCTPSNVALTGTATQSSTYGNGDASLAIDGNTTGTSPWSPDLQHTNNETTPWWQVDLGAEYQIEEIKIFNRTDGFQNRLQLFYVFVSNEPFPQGATLEDLTSDTTLFSFFFNSLAGLEETITLNTQGRYVRIQLSRNNSLHMAEVEVIGCFLQNSPCDGVAPPEITAAGPYLDTDGMQTLSATPAGGTWSGASTDGTFDPSVGAGTYSVTYTYDNAAGCVQSDTIDIVVDAEGSSGCVLSNVALGGTASQSSTYGNGLASLAIDGNTTGTSPWSADLQHTNNETTPWWQVDLGEQHEIEDLNIFNRTNSSQSRLRDFYIFVSSQPFAAGATLADLTSDTSLFSFFFNGPAGLEETLALDTQGRYVRIQLSGNRPLHMAEVEVIGCLSNCDGVAPPQITAAGPYQDTDPVQTLSATPAGGTWSGASTDGTFDPSVGAGTYSVTYTYDNAAGCVQSDTIDIVVQTTGSSGCVLSNVALGGSASQSSTYGNGLASLAIDGNTTGTSPWSADLQHTNNETTPWWQVDLGEQHEIEDLNIFNRTDGLQSRLRDFYIFVSSQPFVAGATLADLTSDTSLFSFFFNGPAGLEETLALDTQGRYVRIQLSGNRPLHMAEVEVIGCISENLPCDGVAPPQITAAGPYQDTDPVQTLSATPAGGTWSGASTDGTFDPSVGAGTYSVTYTYDNAAGCVQSDTIDIVVNADPCDGVAPPQITAAGPYQDTDPVQTLSATPAGGTWSGASTDGTFDPSVGAGTYSVTYTYDNAAGCVQSDTIDIVVNADPCDGVAPPQITAAGPYQDTDPVQTLSATPAGGTWSGASTDGTFDPSVGAGTYSVTYTYDNAAGCVQSDTIDIVVNADPCDGVAPPQITAAGPYQDTDPVQTLSATPAGGTWSGASTDGTFDPSVGAGTYSVTYTYDNAAGCVQSDTIDIVVNADPCDGVAPPQITAAGPYQDTDPVQTLSATPAGGTWSGASTDGTFDPSVGAGTYSVTYTYDNAAGCVQSDTIDIVVNADPCDGVAPPQITAAGPYQDTDPVQTLSATPAGGTWSGASTDGTFDPSVGAGTYSVTYTYDNAAGCVQSDTIDIVVNADPCDGVAPPQITAAGPYQDTDPVQTLSATPAGGTWSGASTDGTFDPSVGAGTYSVTYTYDNAAGCVQSDTIDIVVNADPCDGVAPPQITAAGPYQDTDPVQTLSATPAGGTWSGASTDGTFDPSVGAGTYSVTYTYDNAAGCVQSDTIDIVVNADPCDGVAPPQITAAGPYQDTDPVQTLSATPAGGTWSGASTDGTFDPSVGAGTYSVTYTYDNAAGCVQSDTIDIVVNADPCDGVAPPQITAAGPYQDTDPVQTLSATPAGGTWSGASTDGTFDPSVGAGTYSVTYTYDNAAGCVQSDTIDIVVNADPCDGVAPPQITAAGPYQDTDPVQTLSATPAGGTWSGASTDGTFDPSVGAGTYSVTYTYDNAAGCVQSDTIDIVVNADPCDGVAPPQITAAGPYQDTDPVQTLSATPAGGTWSGASTDGTFDPSVGAGTYSVTYTYDNAAGCVQSDTIDIVVNADPCDGVAPPQITAAGPYQDTDPVQTLSATPAGGTWSGASTDGTFDPSVGAGTYSVTYTYDNAAGCVQSDTIDIVVNADPCDGVAPPQITAAGPYQDTDPVQTLSATPAGGTWSGASTDGTFDPSVGAGTYSVTYTYDNAAGCVQSDTIDIVVQPSGSGGGESSSFLRTYVAPNSSLQLSPVPASTVLNVDYFFANDTHGAIIMRVFDTMGRSVQSKLIDSTSSSQEIDITHLQNGVYILQLVKEDEVLIKRFTVNR